MFVCSLTILIMTISAFETKVRSLSLSRLARSGLAWNNRNLVNSEEKRVVKTEERERLKETGRQ